MSYRCMLTLWQHLYLPQAVKLLDEGIEKYPDFPKVRTTNVWVGHVYAGVGRVRGSV